MRRYLLLTVFAVLVLGLLAGCGGDDEPASSGDSDEAAITDTIRGWLTEGGCDRMTDKFLEDQLLGLGDNRQERCDLFEKQHQKPQYSEDQVKREDVKVTGTKASLIVTSDIAPDIKSRYDLVKTGDQWQIDAAELE